MPKSVHELSLAESINFVLTNRVPRKLLTRLTRRISRIEQPQFTRLAMWLWQRVGGDLNLQEAMTDQFRSIHDCFTRELKPGQRKIDNNPNHIVSPSDGIVVSHGNIDGDIILQAKGYPYTLSELIPDADIRQRYINGRFITLRLTSTMYHRFHAPADSTLKRVIFIPGDMWNVNAAAIKKIDKLYCKNERAVLDLELSDPERHLAVIPIAAIAVASLKLHSLPDDLDMKYSGPTDIRLQEHYARGQEMGYFQHGSTIIVLASENYEFHQDICSNKVMRMGQPLYAFNPSGEDNEFT